MKSIVMRTMIVVIILGCCIMYLILLALEAFGISEEPLGILSLESTIFLMLVTAVTFQGIIKSDADQSCIIPAKTRNSLGLPTQCPEFHRPIDIDDVVYSDSSEPICPACSTTLKRWGRRKNYPQKNIVCLFAQKMQ